MKYVEEKLYDQQIEYIDPLLCLSSVGFTISRTRYGGLDVKVQLADCDRKVTWRFDGSETRSIRLNLEKIDRALAGLQRFRDSYAEAATAHKAWEDRRKKKSRSRKMGRRLGTRRVGR